MTWLHSSLNQAALKSVSGHRAKQGFASFYLAIQPTDKLAFFSLTHQVQGKVQCVF